jgi:predicted ATPase/class 3 adenylate cyclase
VARRKGIAVTEVVHGVGAAPAAGSLHTFLFADIRGYTRFTVEHGDAAAVRLATKFAGVVREVAAQRGGEVIELRGDEALAVFTSVHAALWAAVELQNRLAQESAADPALPLHAGIGVDAGEAIPFEEGYRGGVLNLAARLCALAGPGEVLTNDGVVHLAHKIEGLQYAERGFASLKGFTEPIRVIEVKPSAGQPPAGPVSPDESVPLSDRIETETVGAPPHKLPIGGFLGALPSGPLIGREEELRRLLSAVDVVTHGSGQLVLLVGEPGVGKTRLAQEATLHLRNRGFRVAVGRCYDGDQSVPYYPFREALETLYASCTPALRSVVATQWPDVLLLLPGHGSPSPDADSHGEEEQQRLFWSVTGFLCAASAEAPLGVLLDDVHWADASSLALLKHLAERTRSYPVMLVGAYRDAEVGQQHPLEGVLRDLYREQLTYRINVRRLSKEATSALVAAAMGESEVEENFASLVHHWTEGNPFFVQQVLRVLVERGDVQRQDGHWVPADLAEIEVPESVRSVIRQRLARLTGLTQEILQEASVLGQTFSFDDLQAMGQREERVLEAALEEAGELGLIREAGSDGYHFDHALTQQTLYGELSARRKRRLHLAAGEAEEKISGPYRERRAAEIAWHFMRGGAEERAISYSLLAGDQSEGMFAHAEAEGHYRNALELAAAAGDRRTEAEASGKLGGVLFALGRVEESLATLDAAARAYRELGDREGEMEVLAQAGWALYELGRMQEGIDRVLPALERTRDGAAAPSAAAASLHIALSSLYYASGRAAEALPLADTASQIARQIGDQRLLGDAEGRRGVVLVALGREDAGLQTYGEAIRLAEVTGDLANLTRTLNNRAVVYGDRGDHVRAWKDMERGLDAARRMGSPTHIAWNLNHMGEVARDEGEWDRAESYFDQAVQVLRGVRATRAFAAAELAGLRMLRGESAAVRDLEELTVTGEQTGNAPLYLRAEHWLAEWDLLQGRPGAARERMETILAHPGLEEQYRPESEWALCRALLATGDPETLETIETRLGEIPRGRDLGEWWELRGSLRARQQRWDEANHCFAEALRWARESGHVFREGLALRALGSAHAARGAQAAARERLGEALAIFRRLGARTYVERTESEIAHFAS